MATVGKTEFITSVAELFDGMKKKEVEAVVCATFDLIAAKVAAGDDINIIGFGKFDAPVRASREGKNPQTGEKLTIPEKRVPRFKPGKQFRDSVEAGK